ncbi:hypothetical protein B0H13DRAFT_2313473 [Mycena leptocephala]|nr:hypothetical protein B0H13DRAFT_2313473 [Mycena leptocephala]
MDLVDIEGGHNIAQALSIPGFHDRVRQPPRCIRACSLPSLTAAPVYEAYSQAVEAQIEVSVRYGQPPICASVIGAAVDNVVPLAAAAVTYDVDWPGVTAGTAGRGTAVIAGPDGTDKPEGSLQGRARCLRSLPPPKTALSAVISIMDSIDISSVERPSNDPSVRDVSPSTDGGKRLGQLNVRNILPLIEPAGHHGGMLYTNKATAPASIAHGCHLRREFHSFFKAGATTTIWCAITGIWAFPRNRAPIVVCMAPVVNAGNSTEPKNMRNVSPPSNLDAVRAETTQRAFQAAQGPRPFSSGAKGRRTKPSLIRTIPICLNVDATAPPLPSPPAHLVNDPIIQASLHAMKDHIKVDTSFNVDRFENLLADHPNQPFVKSLMTGLREGFWPFHDGEYKVELEVFGENFATDPADLDAIRAYRDKEMSAAHCQVLCLIMSSFLG